MDDYKETLKEKIIAEYGSLASWIESRGVHSKRFYNFLKGDYNPTVSTLDEWLESVGLRLTVEEIK